MLQRALRHQGLPAAAAVTRGRQPGRPRGMGSTAAARPHQVDWDAYNKHWFDVWGAGLQPGQLFDKGASSPQLLQLLSSGQLDVKGKRALVPGCGRGYDVAAFALAGASASVGLDICPAAVEAARAELRRELAGDLGAAGRCSLLAADFFSFGTGAGGAPGGQPQEEAAAAAAPQGQGEAAPWRFDVGYDLTFLCALHPDMRRDWAAGWARLLEPGGELVTIIYPVDPSLGEGPPWPVTPELYQSLLAPAGFELERLEKIPDGLSHPSRAGREYLGRWRRAAARGAAAGGAGG